MPVKAGQTVFPVSQEARGMIGKYRDNHVTNIHPLLGSGPPQYVHTVRMIMELGESGLGVCWVWASAIGCDERSPEGALCPALKPL